MKKVLAMVLAFVMLTSCTACSKKVEKVEQPVTEVATESEASDIKFGLICLHDENSTYDKNFLDAFTAACEAKGVEYEIKTNIPETNECYEAAADLVDRKCDLIFADSFGHESFIIQAAKEFPNVEFSHATGTMAHTENLPNFHNAFASIYDGRYLAGIAGGMKLKEMMEADPTIEPKVGYVGAFTYAEVISGYTAWYLGVKSIVPEVTMEVQFTGSWYDESLEKEAAQTLMADGCVLISQHADSMGAPTACEENKVPNVSYNGSTINACPNTFIISSRINWQPYFEYMIDCKRNGEAIATDWTGTLETGSVVLTEVNEAVAAEGTQEAINEAKTKLINGELHVFDASKFTVEGSPLNEFMADVDTDENYEKDTNVLSDGYIHESEYRSAPYFDLMIDGITTLNAMF